MNFKVSFLELKNLEYQYEVLLGSIIKVVKVCNNLENIYD